MNTRALSPLGVISGLFLILLGVASFLGAIFLFVGPSTGYLLLFGVLAVFLGVIVAWRL